MGEVAKILIEREIAKPHNIQGCSEADLDRLQEHFNLVLPESYREFLLSMGYSAGDFFKGTHFSYKYLFKLRQWAKELLTETQSSFELPNDAFVFAMHGGYDFFFFQVSEGEDPPVYEYYEGNGTPNRKADTFSEFMINSARVWWTRDEITSKLKAEGRL